MDTLPLAAHQTEPQRSLARRRELMAKKKISEFIQNLLADGPITKDVLHTYTDELRKHVDSLQRQKQLRAIQSHTNIMFGALLPACRDTEQEEALARASQAGMYANKDIWFFAPAALAKGETNYVSPSFYSDNLLPGEINLLGPGMLKLVRKSQFRPTPSDDMHTVLFLGVVRQTVALEVIRRSPTLITTNFRVLNSVLSPFTPDDARARTLQVYCSVLWYWFRLWAYQQWRDLIRFSHDPQQFSNSRLVSDAFYGTCMEFDRFVPESFYEAIDDRFAIREREFADLYGKQDGYISFAEWCGVGTDNPIYTEFDETLDLMHTDLLASLAQHGYKY